MKLYGLEVQYFISPFFYHNPQTYSLNGLQYYNFNTGKLIDSAIYKSGLKYFKCSARHNSDVLIYLYPETFYNPLMTTLYTDLNVRVYINNGQNINNFLVQHQNNVYLNEYSENQFEEHYLGLLTKLDKELIFFNKNNITTKINGSLCNLFL